MDLYEQCALQVAKERIDAAVREAEQMRAIRVARARRSARARLGSVFVRFGHRTIGEPRPEQP